MPLLIGGLWLGRLVSEGVAYLLQTSFSWPLAALITILAGATVLLWQRLLPATWPFYAGTLYLFNPTWQPETAVFSLLLVLFLLLYPQIDHLLAKRRPFVPGLLLALLFLLLYVVTVAPGVLTADNGEFQLIVHQLGVAHPPGFPLYTVLGHLFMRLLPFLEPALSLNLFATLTSAATLFMLYLIVYQLTADNFASTIAVLALGSATTFWAQATIANIRSMTALFAALMLWTLIHFWGERPFAPHPTPPQTAVTRDKWLRRFVFVALLGITHHLSLAFMGLIFGLFVLHLEPQLWRSRRRLLSVAGAGSLGLLPLLYLPWRGLDAANVRGAMAGLTTLPGFLHHVLGLGFQGDFFYFTTPALFWQRLQIMGQVMRFQFTPLLLIAATLALLLLLWRNRRLAFLLGGSFLIHTVITALYRAPQSVEYMLPATVPVAISLGTLVGYAKRWPPTTGGQNIVAAGTTAVLLVAALFQGWQQWPSFKLLHQTQDTYRYASTIFEQAPTNSVVLANWHWVTPLWYLQEVEGKRPDLTIRYVAPANAPYASTWVAEISRALTTGQPVVATYFDAGAYQSLPPPHPIGEAFLFGQPPTTVLPDSFAPFAVAGESTVQFVGYRLSQEAVAVGETFLVTIAWQAETETAALPFFVHLLGFDGRLYAQDDQALTATRAGLTLTQFRLTPRPGTRPGDYTLRAGVSLPTGEVAHSFGTINVTAATQRPFTQNPTYRLLFADEQRRTLVGYDWDSTLPGQMRLYLHWQTPAGYISELYDNGAFPQLPPYAGAWGVWRRRWQITPPAAGTHYVPLGDGLVWLGGDSFSTVPLTEGSRQDLTQTVASGRPILRDYVLSVRLIGYQPDSDLWAWCDLNDSVPAMGAIPTLKWVTNSVVWSPYTAVYAVTNPPQFLDYCKSDKGVEGAPLLYVEPALSAGGQRIGATVRLYDAFTKRPLPILDERITAQFPWIPLGETVLGE